MTTSELRGVSGFISLGRDAFRAFMADRALRLGAGLAYYGIVTLVPLLILFVGVVGLLLGEEIARDELAGTIESRVGSELASMIVSIIDGVDVVTSFTNLTIFSLAALVFTASVLFVAWKDALNVIWAVEYRGGVKQTLARRLFGMAVVGGLGALIVALILLESVLAMLSSLFSDELLLDAALRFATSLIPGALTAVLLALMYRYGPDREAPWKWVAQGTLVAMALVYILTWGYGLYVDATSASVTGVASSALLLIFLVYGIAQVLLFGAEIVKVQTIRHEAEEANDDG